ncbi:MAG: aminotransferase class I/II-fold pyridoxal phosphate-dependent enzyme [Herbaspirillum sp.]|nr:aminotransferase class I/II-fold pyridoxal phosphate-dependent enzyme [Herbaspirillum sp.]
MEQFLASRLDAVKVSPSSAAKARVDSLRAAGRQIVNFTIGEPDFPTPRHIVEAGIAALNDGQTRYTGAGGTPALRQAIVAKLKRDNDLSYKDTEVVVGNGAKQIIFCALTATLNAGDEVIIPTPYWVSYPDMVALNDGRPVIVSTRPETGFKLTPAQLEEAITDRTRWLVLNTPSNPTGAIYTSDELLALAQVLREHPNVWLLTDEIYEHFSYGTVRHVSPLTVAPDLASRTLIVNGVSKSHAMTGWRIGYGAAPRVLVAAIELLLSQSTSCASSISQAAAVTALDGPQDCVADAVALFDARRRRMVELLNAVPGLSCGLPDGAFYVFVSVAGLIGKTTPSGQRLDSDVDVMMYFLDTAGVATIDGSSYGQPNYLRMSFATSIEQIEVGCRALASVVAELKN